MFGFFDLVGVGCGIGLLSKKPAVKSKNHNDPGLFQTLEKFQVLHTWIFFQVVTWIFFRFMV